MTTDTTDTVDETSSSESLNDKDRKYNLKTTGQFPKYLSKVSTPEKRANISNFRRNCCKGLQWKHSQIES